MPIPPSDILLAGHRLTPDLSGALWWPERGWLVVADLHLEKASAYARRGQMLPPYDTAATLARLEQSYRQFQPARVICLGDSFHDRDAAARVSAADGRRVAALIAANDWVWITGNHDPAPPAGWGGRILPELAEAGLLFRHEAAADAGVGEISGHYHPKAALHTRGGRVVARCFAADGRRLILPAFGSLAGGLNVRDQAIARLMAPDFQVWMLGRDAVHRFPASRLAAEPPRPALTRPGP